MNRDYTADSQLKVAARRQDSRRTCPQSPCGLIRRSGVSQVSGRLGKQMSAESEGKSAYEMELTSLSNPSTLSFTGVGASGAPKNRWEEFPMSVWMELGNGKVLRTMTFLDVNQWLFMAPTRDEEGTPSATHSQHGPIGQES